MSAQSQRRPRVDWHCVPGLHGTQNDLCVGGAILSLDLKQAFDRVNRQALVQALRRLQAPEELIAAVIALHDTSAYHIHDAFNETKVITTRGIRQGCKLAPLLWVAISTAILHELGPALSGPHKQATTFADDTLCQWIINRDRTRCPRLCQIFSAPFASDSHAWPSCQSYQDGPAHTR